MSTTISNNSKCYENSKAGLQGLLYTMISLLVLFPIGFASRFTALFLSICMTVLLVFSVYSISNNKKTLTIGLLLAIPTLITSWLPHFIETQLGATINIFTNIIFIGFIIFCLFKIVFTTKEVTSDIIAGSICIYLLLGFLWGFIYVLCDLLQPNSFSLDIFNESTQYDYFYFSFITLTSLGYGDVIPSNSISQTFSMMEALAGQIYMTVMVAWLVGVYISQNTSNRSDHQP